MEKILIKIDEINLPTTLGDFSMLVFQNTKTGKYASVLKLGDVQGQDSVLVRIHSSCLTGDVFESLLCDCGQQLRQSLETISKAGAGVLIYLDQEGRGIGLGNKIKALKLQQDDGLDTVEANLALKLPVDARTFEEAAEIIRALRIKSVRILTNNPRKIAQLGQFGVKVAERVPCVIDRIEYPQITRYLKTKKEKMGHFLPSWN